MVVVRFVRKSILSKYRRTIWKGEKRFVNPNHPTLGVCLVGKIGGFHETYLECWERFKFLPYVR